MCGIMGFVKTGETNQKTGEVITKVLRQLQSRGTHATGVSFFKREKGNGISLYAKAPMDAEEFTRTDTYLDLLGGDYSMMLGHTRFATSGSPQINDNNHPHVSDDGRYALVHNGIISRVTGDLKKRCRTECDSEALLRLIERDGIEDGFSRMCRVKTMDYAVMITDGQTDRMYLTRNEARPLCFSESDRRKSADICSARLPRSCWTDWSGLASLGISRIGSKLFGLSCCTISSRGVGTRSRSRTISSTNIVTAGDTHGHVTR
jgi:glucosamine 6-phosphate synthetase-like amidotransferase/phosphosugar isomerase protein